MLNLNTKEWSIVASLCRAVFCASGCISGDILYVLGGFKHGEGGSKIDVQYAYKASVTQLIESHDGDAGVFEPIQDLPLRRSTCTIVDDQNIAIGGSQCIEDFDEPIATNLVFVYCPEDGKWKRVNNCQLIENRCYCFAVSVTHPKPQLLVVGGYTVKPDEGCTSSVEIVELDTHRCSGDFEGSRRRYESSTSPVQVLERIDEVNE